MKDKIFYKRLLILTILLSLISGCTNISSSINNKNESRLIVRIISPQSSCLAVQHRAAVPSLPEERIFWRVEAINTTASSTEALILTSEANEESKSFIMEISSGSWEIQVLGFENEAEMEEGLSEKAIFAGESQILVSQSGQYEANIQVYFVKEGLGAVDLSIDASDSELDRLLVKGTGKEIDGFYFKDASGAFKIQKEAIESGTYSPVFTFYKCLKEDALNAVESDFVQVLSLQETINVRQNVTTKNWIKSGNTIYLKARDDNYADFILSSEIILKLVNTSFYVCSKELNERKLPEIALSPSDSNSGYWTAPFESIAAAVKKIQVLNKTSLENNPGEDNSYTIYIDGPLYNQQAIFVEMNNFPCSITIRPYKNPQGESSAKIYGGNNPDNQNNIFTISGNNRIILSDIEIAEGNIQVEADGNLILQGRPELSEGFIVLKDNAFIQLDNIDCCNDENGERSIIAKIKSSNPVKNKLVLEGYNNQPLSSDVVESFRLNNPGYYLDYNQEAKNAFINESSVNIILPKIGPASVHISASNSNNNINKDDKGVFIISQDFSATPVITAEETRFSVTVERTDNNYLNNSKISLTLYSQDCAIIYGSNSQDNSYTKELLLPEGFIFSGNYILEVKYEYDDIFYDVKALVKIL